MTYNLSFKKKYNYLHVKVTGENSMDNVKRYLEEVLLKCKDTKCSRLLIEEQLVGPRLDTFKVFEIAAKGSVQSHGLFKAIAYVDINAEGNLMHFAENVAFNRALPVQIFQTVVEAEKWLLQKS
ncbi:MAG: hypothetical protein KJO26_12530 [Deltaproteobacteria bacterium]|nr:hypothetical protein [Deltaproteobacteria bacterium]